MPLFFQLIQNTMIQFRAGILLVLLLNILNLHAFAAKPADVHVYPLPSIYKTSGVYQLKVNGVEVPVVSYTDQYDYAGFSMSGLTANAEISLTDTGTEVTAFNISPQKFNINGTASGNKLSFSIAKGQYLIVKIGNNRELVITADAAERDKPLASGPGIFNITSAPYSAKSSEQEMATVALQKAIDDAAAYGNGIVYVPAGVYPVGNLHLKSNTRLYLEGGAVLLFSGHKKDYQMNARKASQNRDITWWLYTDSGAHDIKIYGRGTLDGNGKYATEKEGFGNHILTLLNTRNFSLEGITIRNSGAWAVLPVRSRDMVFQDFKLYNRFDMGENDGIDVIESQNVLVRHAIGIGLDDPFSTKTWSQATDIARNWPGRPKAQDNIRFEDCLSWTYCYGYKIGQGVLQDQSNIVFKNCVVYDAAVGIGVHHKWGNAAIYNVLFDGIDIEKLSHQNDDHRTWLVFLMQNGDKTGSGPISGISVNNIRVRDQGNSPGKIRGLNDSIMIRNVSFKNVVMPDSESPATSLFEMGITDTAHQEYVRVSNGGGSKYVRKGSGSKYSKKTASKRGAKSAVKSSSKRGSKAVVKKRKSSGSKK